MPLQIFQSLAWRLRTSIWLLVCGARMHDHLSCVLYLSSQAPLSLSPLSRMRSFDLRDFAVSSDIRAQEALPQHNFLGVLRQPARQVSTSSHPSLNPIVPLPVPRIF
jgi:hypothetical protein